MHAKKSLVTALIIATLIIPCFLMPRTSAEKNTVVFSVTGTYYLAQDQSRVVDEDLSITIENESVSIDYYMSSLPYSINTSMLYLTVAERNAWHLIPESEIKISREEENDPFTTYFACQMLVATITRDEYTAVFKWHASLGFLLYAEISKTHEIQAILRITYKSSSQDLYKDYGGNYLQKIYLYKFLVSPVGIIVLAIPLVLVLFLICYISNTRKKIKSSIRGGRMLTR